MDTAEFPQKETYAGTKSRPLNDLEIKKIPRISSLEDVPFKGFESEESVLWVRRQIERSGLPTKNITVVTFRPNEPGRENVLGQADLGTGELRLYKSLEKTPEIAQLATIIHENAHHFDPTRPWNEELYGGKEKMDAAAEHALAIAKQTHITRTYLNGYHRLLHERYTTGKITETHFVMETHAIMAELRFTNPEHLNQVQEAQHNKLQKMKDEELKRPLLSQDRDILNTKYTEITAYHKGGNISEPPIGIDQTLLAVMKNPDLKSSKTLNDHIVMFRSSFDKERSPIRQKN